MKPEVSQALIDAHAAVFVRPDGDDREPGRVLIECGDGWHDLLDGMAREIESWATASGIVAYLWQAKEKFGALRVHWRSADEERLAPEERAALQAIIASAEKRSEHVCEGCGRPGRLSVDDGVVRMPFEEEVNSPRCRTSLCGAAAPFGCKQNRDFGRNHWPSVVPDSSRQVGSTSKFADGPQERTRLRRA